MSQNYSGLADNISAPAPIVVSAVTVANPAKLTVPAHGRQTGDKVHISGEAVLAPINGIWTVTVIDANTFTIPVNAGGTEFVSTTATMQALAFPGAATPSDGDDATAASVDTPIDNVYDRTAALGVMTGSVKLAEMQPINNTSWQNDAGVPPGGNWLSVSPTANVFIPTGQVWTLSKVCVGDVVDVDFRGTLLVGTSDLYAVKLYAENTTPGGSGSYAPMKGTAQLVGGATTGITAPVAMRAQFVCTVAGDLNVQLYMFANVVHTMQMIGDYNMFMTVWRPTGMAQ